MRFGNATPPFPPTPRKASVARSTRVREAACGMGLVLAATGLWANPEPWKHFLLLLLSIFACWLYAQMGVGGVFYVFPCSCENLRCPSMRCAVFVGQNGRLHRTKWAASSDKMGG